MEKPVIYLDDLTREHVAKVKAALERECVPRLEAWCKKFTDEKRPILETPRFSQVFLAKDKTGEYGFCFTSTQFSDWVKFFPEFDVEETILFFQADYQRIWDLWRDIRTEYLEKHWPQIKAE